MADVFDPAFRQAAYRMPSPSGRRPPLSDGANRPGVAPGFGDGGYLPGLDEREVDIATIALESTTGDVIAVRAMPVADGIRYAVVDEYDSEFTMARPVRAGTLTLGEVMELIDTVAGPHEMVGLVEAHLELTYLDDTDPEDLRGFVSVSSDFYPQLTAYYEGRVDDWIAEKQTERAG